jgi:DNA invertase Pin-like site-specific DNA recombinase
MIGESRTTPTRVALYARVSTETKGQATENQLLQLREYCQRQGYQIVQEYIDHATGKHSDRDAFKAMFNGASRKEFDTVLVWSLDRFTREGVLETFEHVRRLTTCGVAFESYTEQHFRTTGPAGELMLAVSAWIARQERQRISDRTKAGVERARRSGKHCGRPKRVFNRALAVALRSEGWSWNKISSELGGVPVKTIRRAIDTYGESPAADGEIRDGNDTTSPVSIALGDTDRLCQPTGEVQP